MVESNKLLKVNPPIHRLGSAGRWVRAQLQAGILSGTPVLVRIQNLRSPWLNRTMHVISFLGEEDFYTPLVAFIVWVVDAQLGRLLALLMALAFYLTGTCKNLLCLPRPPAPPIAPLQRCNDWSLPSHHAVLSVNVPWYIWFSSIHANSTLGPAALTFLFSAIALWSFLVMFSRVYLGVHSPADILTGGVMGCLLLALWLLVDTAVDGYLASSPGGSLVVLSVVILLLGVHPDPSPTTIIFAETTCMVGVATGFAIGRCHAPPGLLYAVMEKRHTYSSALSLVGSAVARLGLGLLALVLAKALAASLIRAVLAGLGRLAGVPTTCVKRVSKVTSERVHYSTQFLTEEGPTSPKSSERGQWHWSHDSPLNLDIPVKFLSYTAMGLVAVAIAPYLFHCIGI